MVCFFLCLHKEYYSPVRKTPAFFLSCVLFSASKAKYVNLEKTHPDRKNCEVSDSKEIFADFL